MLKLNLQDSIDRAMEYSPAIKLKKNQQEQVKFDYRDALGGALPNISASFDMQNYTKKPVISGFSLNSTYQRDTGITVSQPLFSFGAVGNAIRAADAAVDVSNLDEVLTKRQVEYAVKLSYYNIQLAQKQLDILDQALGNAKENLRILRRYFSSGRPPQQDLIRLQTDVASRTSQVQEARQTLAQAESKFKILLGLPLSKKVELQFEPNQVFRDLTDEEIQQGRLETQPQLQIYDKQIEYSEYLAKAQRATIYPQLDAYYTWSTSARSDRGAFDTDSTVDTGVVGLKLTWNIWAGGSNRAKLDKAYAVQRTAQIQKAQQKDDLVEALQDKAILYRTLKENLKNDEASVRLAKESFRVSQSRFRTGKASVTELNSTEAQLYQAQLNKALHEFQLHESLAAIRQLLSE